MPMLTEPAATCHGVIVAPRISLAGRELVPASRQRSPRCGNHATSDTGDRRRVGADNPRDRPRTLPPNHRSTRQELSEFNGRSLAERLVSVYGAVGQTFQDGVRLDLPSVGDGTAPRA